MALYYELQVFKDVYALVQKVFLYTQEFPREYKYTLGQDMKRDAIQLVRSIYRANKSKDKELRWVTRGIFYCRVSAGFSVSASNKLSCNLTGQCFEIGNKNIPPAVGVNLKIEMFNLFRKSKKSKTELEFFKQFFKSDYKYFGKIHFPVLIYPELPAKPIFKNWRIQQQYIIDKVIPLSFKEDFNTAYSKYDGQRFEMIEKNQNGDINHSKRNAMVQHYLDSQQKVFMSKRELERTEFKIGDFNVFIQYLDDTPQQILETTLKAISAELPNSELILQRFPDERNEFKLNKLLLTLEDIAPYHHLDRMYDTERIWELLQPEESSFLMIGTNSNNVINRLNEKGLEIEGIEN